MGFGVVFSAISETSAYSIGFHDGLNGRLRKPRSHYNGSWNSEYDRGYVDGREKRTDSPPLNVKNIT